MIDLDRIKPDSKLSTDLGADSLDVVELTMEIEQVFRIEIDDENEAEKLRDATIEEIAKFVDSKIS